MSTLWTYFVEQPKSLERLALVKLTEWITSQAEKWMSQKPNAVQKVVGETDGNQAEESLSRQIEVIRNIIECNVPRTLHDELFIQLIKAMEKLQDKIKLDWSTFNYNYKKIVHLRITGTLFTKYLNTLKIDYAIMLRLKASLFSKAHLLSGLTRLEFGFCQGYYDTTNETQIIESLKCLPNLKDFTIERVFTDNILNCLLEHCKLIEKLGLESSSEINDASINILIQFLFLKNVNLSGTSVTKLGIAYLLTSCRNIEAILNNWSNKIAPALEYIASMRENVGTQFQLKSYLNHRDTTYTQLKYVVQMCPQIRKIELCKYNTLGSLGIFKNLQNLQELLLQNFDFHGDGISELLEASGHKLTQLRLFEINQLDLNDLIFICKMCPNLETLAIRCTVLPSTYHGDENALKILPLRHLKTLVFHSHRPKLYIAEREFIFLVSNCPHVEFVRSSISLNDDIMLKIMNKNPLIYLQKFKMLNSTLSVAVIDQIVRNCIIPPILINYHRNFIYDGNEF